MNIDVSSDTFRTQLDDAVKLLKSFSQLHSLTVDAAISIIMVAASHEGGFDAIITMEKVLSAIGIDYKSTNLQSRQQRRWETRQASKTIRHNVLKEQFPDIFTFDPIRILNPED